MDLNLNLLSLLKAPDPLSLPSSGYSVPVFGVAVPEKGGKDEIGCI